MGIIHRITVECDQCDCDKFLVVRCTLSAKTVPGPVEYKFHHKDWSDSGWQEIHDFYHDETIDYYCPDHRRKTRY